MSSEELFQRLKVKLHIGWSAIKNQFQISTLDEETIDEVFEDLLDFVNRITKGGRLYDRK